MSRVYQNQPSSTARRASLRPSHPPPPPPHHPPASTSSIRGNRAPTQGRVIRTQPPRQERHDNSLPTEDNRMNQQQQRTTHVGDGFHMIPPSITKHEEIKRQAEIEKRQYEEHIERTRLRGIHEVNRLGGDGLTEDEVRRRQAEKYRREKFMRAEKSQQNQIQKQQEEEKAIEAKKQAARLQSIENEKRDREQSNRGATGWTTDEAREEDRRKTMDRFLNGLTQQCDNMYISSDEDEKRNPNDLSKSKKLSILHDALPHIDQQTLERYLEIYDGNIDTIVCELSS